MKRLLSISVFFSRHSFAGQILLIVLSIILTAIGVLVGAIINDWISANWVWWFISGLILYGGIAFVYPRIKKKRSVHRFFSVRLKLMSLAYLAVYLLSISGGIKWSQEFCLQVIHDSSQSLSPEFVFVNQRHDSGSASASGNHTFHLTQKIGEKISAVKNKLMAKNNPWRLLLLFLLFGVSLGLIGLLPVIACEIACAGYEIIAWIVMLGGTTAVIWFSGLAFIELFGITDRKKKNKARGLWSAVLGIATVLLFLFMAEVSAPFFLLLALVIFSGISFLNHLGLKGNTSTQTQTRETNT